MTQTKTPEASSDGGFELLCHTVTRRIGGDGGDRTRVRKSSTVSSTYLVWPFGFNRCTADRQAAHWRVTLDLVPEQVTRSDTIPSK